MGKLEGKVALVTAGGSVRSARNIYRATVS